MLLWFAKDYSLELKYSHINYYRYDKNQKQYLLHFDKYRLMRAIINYQFNTTTTVPNQNFRYYIF